MFHKITCSTKNTRILPEIRRDFHRAPQKELSLSVFTRWRRGPGELLELEFGGISAVSIKPEIRIRLATNARF